MNPGEAVLWHITASGNNQHSGNQFELDMCQNFASNNLYHRNHIYVDERVVARKLDVVGLVDNRPSTY